RAHLYRKLGNSLRDQYRYDEAQSSYDAAEVALGSPDADADEAAWFCWGQIKLERINVYYWLGQTREMLELIDQIRLLFEQRGSIMQQARLHQISAIALLRANRYDHSIQAVEHAFAYLKIIQETDDERALPAAHFQVGFSLLWATNNLATSE